MNLHTAYEQLSLPLYISDLSTFEVLYINAMGKNIFGDVVGRKCYEAFNGTKEACGVCISSKKLEECGSFCTEKRYLSKLEKYVDTYESIVTLPDGKKARLCLVVDITEQERIRKENKQSEVTRRDMQHLINMQSCFIASAKSMMSAAGLDGTMIFVNKTMCETLGFSQDEVLKMRIPDFHPPEIAEEFTKKHVPHAIKEGLWKGDTLVYKKDGSCLPVRIIVFPVLDEEGKLIATAAIMDDITKTLELERMNRYQIAILESSTSYIGVSDRNGKTLFHNPGAYRMMGYEPGSIVEWDKSVPHPKWYFDRIINEGIPTAIENGQWIGRGELIDRYGKHIPIEQTIFPVYDENSQIIGTATIIQDITEQLKQQKEIEEGRRTLRTIIDTAPSAIFWKDKNSCFLGANKQFAKEAGVDDPDDLIGKSDYDFYPKELADLYVAADRKVFETGEEQRHMEELFQGAEGITHCVSTSKVLIRNENNEPVALLGIYDDITKIKQNEIKLEEAIKAAEDASRAKGDFLSRMSHEIRTPMNAIKGLAELLALTELNSVQLNYVQNIVKSSNSLLSIINDVLDFSKMSENKIEFIESQYDLEDLISEASNVVSLRASEKGLMLLMEVSPTLPKTLIGDEVRVKQVIINILNNAVKYTKEGHVILRLYGQESEKGFELVCAVEDTGIGIKSEDIPFLFEAFSQADRRMNHNIQGTGLGLSISDRLIRGMEGSITVRSEYGKGSVFTARFPQGIGSSEPIARVVNPQNKHVLLLERDERIKCAGHMLDELCVAYTAAASIESYKEIKQGNYTHCIYDDSFSREFIKETRNIMPDCLFIALKDMRYAMDQSDLHDAVLFIPLLITELAKAVSMDLDQREQQINATRAIDNFVLQDTHILVVDDNEINLLVSEEILRAYEADVTCVESGQSALDICEKTKFDIIFMDHMMPGMDGIETTIALREREGLNRATPVIALTANVVNDMAKKYLQSGMDDFISKPIEFEELRRVLLKWLPEGKVTSLRSEKALKEKPAEEPKAITMEKLIQSLDAFGMYVSEVMKEINNDYDLYIQRMYKICDELMPLVDRMREEVQKELWDDFARDIGDMGAMIHDVGARDCSGRARKLVKAAMDRNIDYVLEDFYSLMDNMYMLTKKMEVAVILAQGGFNSNIPFGDIEYCYNRLKDMMVSLINKDKKQIIDLIDILAHYSLDHELDLIVMGIRTKVLTDDFKTAISLHKKAMDHCSKLRQTSS